MAEEKQYQYGMTPDKVGDGLAAYFSGIWGEDRSPSRHWFTGTRREIISPREVEYKKEWTGLEGEHRYRKKVTPGVYGPPEHDLEYMPIYRAAQGIGDFFEDIFSSSEAREEAGEALVTGIGTLAKDQMDAIFHMGVTGEPSFYDPEQGRAIRHDPFLIAAPGFAAGRLFPVQGAVSGMFAGRSSPAAPLGKLKVAEDTAAKRNYGKGASRQENEATRNDIFEETGWFRYHDNDGNPVHDWRFEISDHQAELVHDPKFLTPKGRLRDTGDTPLLISNLLRHPELFSAYSGAFGPGEGAEFTALLKSKPDRVSSSAQVPLSLAEITRQRAAIKLEWEALKKSGLDIKDPVYVAEYQRLQAEDGAVLDRLIAEEISDSGVGKKPDKPAETTDPESFKHQPLAEIPVTKKSSKEWGSAHYSPRTDTIGIKRFPGHPMSKKVQNIPWDEKGVFTEPYNLLTFAKKEKEAREMFKRAGISLDSSGSYSPINRINDIEFSLRKLKGPDWFGVDPADLPPYLKEVWDELQNPVTRYYKKDYDPTQQFVGSALHELQHGLQYRHPGTFAGGIFREELSGGSSPKSFVRKHFPPSVTKKWKDDGTGKKLSAEELYMRTLGEAEARNTDLRQSLTPVERKKPGKRPWETLDRKEGDLRTREQWGLPPTHRLALGREASGDKVFTSGPDKVFTSGPDNIFKTSELNYLPESIGQVTDQIDKKVGRTNISLRPSEFLQLAEEFNLNTKSSADRIQFLEDAIRDSRAIAPPWLTVQWVPEKSAWKVLGHEGRHRVTAGENVFGDESLPVHLFLRNSSDDGRLGRKIEVDQLSSEMQQALENRRFIPEEGGEIVGLPEQSTLSTGEFFELAGEEGVWQEYPSVGKLLDNYIYNIDHNALFEAQRHPEYGPYKDVIETLLEQKFPSGTIPVSRIEGYADPFAEKTRSIFNINLEDVAFVGSDAERELIITTDGGFRSVRLVEEPGKAAGFEKSPLIDTPEFKSWFKRSNVINDKGHPLVVYHGTSVGDPETGEIRESFLASDKSWGRRSHPSDLGEWFTEDPPVADHFAGERTLRGEEVGPHVIPVYLSLQNPKIFESYDDLEDALNTFEDKRIAPSRTNPDPPDFVDHLKEQGYDGIEIENSFTDVLVSRRDFVIFDGNQAKSTFNVGTFDPLSSNIGKAAGGFVDKPLYDRAL